MLLFIRFFKETTLLEVELIKRAEADQCAEIRSAGQTEKYRESLYQHHQIDILLLNLVYVYTTKVWNDFHGWIHINEGPAWSCSGCLGMLVFAHVSE